jgi:hypothetical protein
MSSRVTHRASTPRAHHPMPSVDHRHKTEDLLEQLAGLLPQDKLTQEVLQARRRRALARRTIAIRLVLGSRDEAPT